MDQGTYRLPRQRLQARSIQGRLHHRYGIAWKWRSLDFDLPCLPWRMWQQVASLQALRQVFRLLDLAFQLKCKKRQDHLNRVHQTNQNLRGGFQALQTTCFVFSVIPFHFCLTFSLCSVIFHISGGMLLDSIDIEEKLAREGAGMDERGDWTGIS